MKIFGKLTLLLLAAILPAICVGQSNAEEIEIQKTKSDVQTPPQIPENVKKQDRLVKQIYSLQRELRDLKIQNFKIDVIQVCDILDNYDELHFSLDRKSGNLIEYKTKDSKIEIPCIEDRLLRIQRNFGSMSFGFNNAFKMAPTSKFTVSIGSGE